MNIHVTRFLFLPLVVLFFSCTQEFTEELCPRIDSQRVQSSHLSVADIEEYITMCRDVDNTKSMLLSIDPLVDDEDTIAYIVNYPDGWEVLSADRRTDPVLIMCKSGSITKEELYSSPAQTAYMNNLVHNLKELAETPEIATKSSFSTSTTPPMSYTDEDGNWWVYVGRRLVTSQSRFQDHLLDTQWGQGETSTNYTGWNISMPYYTEASNSHCYAGCVPVAGAQVLYYLHYTLGTPEMTPVSSMCSAHLSGNRLTLRSSNVSFAPKIDCWDDMPKTLTSATSISDLEKVSTLLLRIGFKCNATYMPNGTSVSLYSLKNTMSSEYGISCTRSSSLSNNTIINWIYQNRLPVIAGVSTSHASESGEREPGAHAIIIDGCDKLFEQYAYQYRCGAPDSGIYHEEYYNFSHEYFAINWGYDGAGQVDDSGETIWYNTSYTYSIYGSRIESFDEYLYGFQIR